jgi:hypothetical protein
MSELTQEIHTRISEKLADIEAICAEYKYEVVPTLLLRHAKGPSSSMLLSNDSPSTVVLCIAEIGNVGEVVEDTDPA